MIFFMVIIGEVENKFRMQSSLDSHIKDHNLSVSADSQLEELDIRKWIAVFAEINLQFLVGIYFLEVDGDHTDPVNSCGLMIPFKCLKSDLEESHLHHKYLECA